MRYGCMDVDQAKYIDFENKRKVERMEEWLYLILIAYKVHCYILQNINKNKVSFVCVPESHIKYWDKLIRWM